MAAESRVILSQRIRPSLVPEIEVDPTVIA